MFLQNWRATLIPLIAVPVAIVGTFAVMAAIGFSLNNLSLFGLVLAIGIVVDDAIVVVEAVEHHIEHGLSPREATHQGDGGSVRPGRSPSPWCWRRCSCRARSSRGITGQFFRQFALTIAVSTVISAFNSLTLSPALSALLLRPREKGQFEPLPWFAFVPLGAWLGHKSASIMAVARGAGWRWRPGRLAAAIAGRAAALGADRARGAGGACWSAGCWAGRSTRLLGWSFRAFNRGFDWPTERLHAARSAWLLRVSLLVLLVYGGLLCLTWLRLHAHADRLHPAAGQGLSARQRAAARRGLGRAHPRTSMQQIEEIALRDAGRRAHRRHLRPVDPARRQRVQLRHAVRDARRLRAPPRPDAVRPTPSPRRCRRRSSSEVPEASSTSSARRRSRAWARPAASSSSSRTAATSACARCRKQPTRSSPTATQTRSLQGLFTSFRADTPWLYLDIDRAQAKDRGVSIDDVCTTLQVYLGLAITSTTSTASAAPGRSTSRPTATFRQQVDDLKQLKVRNDAGRDGAAGGLRRRCSHVSGPVMVMRYNMYPSAAVNGDAGAGHQLRPGDRPAGGRRPNDDLPQSMRTEWTELALLQLQTGNTAMWVFVLAVVLVFLVLAAQYESWSLPLAVILVVPMCLLVRDRRRADRPRWTSTSSRRSASWCWSAWRARTPS